MHLRDPLYQSRHHNYGFIQKIILSDNRLNHEVVRPFYMQKNCEKSRPMSASKFASNVDTNGLYLPKFIHCLYLLSNNIVFSSVKGALSLRKNAFKSYH